MVASASMYTHVPVLPCSTALALRTCAPARGHQYRPKAAMYCAKSSTLTLSPTRLWALYRLGFGDGLLRLWD